MISDRDWPRQGEGEGSLAANGLAAGVTGVRRCRRYVCGIGEGVRDGRERLLLTWSVSVTSFSFSPEPFDAYYYTRRWRILHRDAGGLVDL